MGSRREKREATADCQSKQHPRKRRPRTAARLDQEETLRKAAWCLVFLHRGRADIPAARHGFPIWSHQFPTLLVSALARPVVALPVGALSRKPQGGGFNSWSEHVLRLQVQLLVGVHERQPMGVSLTLSLSRQQARPRVRIKMCPTRPVVGAVSVQPPIIEFKIWEAGIGDREMPLKLEPRAHRCGLRVLTASPMKAGTE